MKMIAAHRIWFLFLALSLISVPQLTAQADEPASTQSSAIAAQESHETFGTSAYSQAPDLSADAATVLVPLKPTIVLAKASYATGGVALRNRGAGNISVSGLVGPSRLTLLYWAVITAPAAGGPPPAAVRSIQIQRLNPVPASAVVVLNGVQIGAGPAPCWGPAGAIITVFRAVVPAAVTGPGNGSYQLTLLPGAGGLVNGADPWTPPVVLPLWEGASLVMIGNGAGTVSIFDAGLAGKTFTPNPVAFNYVLALPVAPPGKRTLIDNIGADGQHTGPASRDAMLSVSDETTTINGMPVAGPGSNYVDSDWNGSSGLPLPELWDDTGHDITPVTQDRQMFLDIVINSALGPADCLTPVANVVAEQ
jgi:hypothetical protein